MLIVNTFQCFEIWYNQMETPIGCLILQIFKFAIVFSEVISLFLKSGCSIKASNNNLQTGLINFYFSSWRSKEFMISGTGLTTGPGNLLICESYQHATYQILSLRIACLLWYIYWLVLLHVSRYPLGRVIGGTVYPGLTLTAGTIWK